MLFLVVFLTLSSGVLPIVLALGLVALGVGTWWLGRGLPERFLRWRFLVLALGVAGAFEIVMEGGGVGWEDWGGLMLTVFLAVGGIVLSFPFGVLLALGRRSSLPAIRAVSVAYIELIRGVPLITLLFMGRFVLGLFVPAGFEKPGVVTRALIAITMFSAAYAAEIVRGGLQGVPRGQVEAAQALGLSPLRVMRFVVLPQALRSVIPAMVGHFISLFKDTSLVAIIGLVEFLRIGEIVTQQTDFRAQGLQAEVFLFVSFVFWVGAYWMSRQSQRLEQRLGVGER